MPIAKKETSCPNFYRSSSLPSKSTMQKKKKIPLITGHWSALIYLGLKCIGNKKQIAIGVLYNFT